MSEELECASKCARVRDYVVEGSFVSRTDRDPEKAKKKGPPPNLPTQGSAQGRPPTTYPHYPYYIREVGNTFEQPGYFFFFLLPRPPSGFS